MSQRLRRAQARRRVQIGGVGLCCLALGALALARGPARNSKPTPLLVASASAAKPIQSAAKPIQSAAKPIQAAPRRGALPRTTPQKIVGGARAQSGDIYDPSYFRISYPNGDVPAHRGACTDVIIRALRAAGSDLQALMHRDMKKRFAAYPRRYGLKRPDKNIDHRRVPNQMVFFKKFGRALPLQAAWKPGDLVFWKLDSGLDHCGVVSDRRGASGSLMVIHNLSTCAEEDCLATWKITGHFRFPR